MGFKWSQVCGGTDHTIVPDCLLASVRGATLAAECMCKWTAARILLPRQENDGDDAADALRSDDHENYYVGVVLVWPVSADIHVNASATVQI